MRPRGRHKVNKERSSPQLLWRKEHEGNGLILQDPINPTMSFALLCCCLVCARRWVFRGKKPLRSKKPSHM